jgi:mRNA interferase MazF
VQNDVGNAYSPNTIVAAITRTIRRYPVNVTIEPEESGLPDTSMVDCSLLLTIAKPRILNTVGTLSAETMAQIDTALKTSLGIA